MLSRMGENEWTRITNAISATAYTGQVIVAASTTSQTYLVFDLFFIQICPIYILILHNIIGNGSVSYYPFSCTDCCYVGPSWRPAIIFLDLGVRRLGKYVWIHHLSAWQRPSCTSLFHQIKLSSIYKNSGRKITLCNGRWESAVL